MNIEILKENQREYSREYYYKNKQKIQKRQKDYYERNKDKIKEYSKKFFLDHRKKILLRAIKTRAIKRGWVFDLSIEDLEFPEYCPVLGVKLDFSNRDSAASVDRIDNNKGYTKDNIQIISMLANRMKNSATKEQLLMFSKWITQTYA